jgi:hypothetical protein
MPNASATRNEIIRSSLIARLHRRKQSGRHRAYSNLDVKLES